MQIGIKTVRDYKPAYDIETLKQQPMLATLDPGAANQLYRSLECQLGIAFNDRTFENASCTADTIVSPLSTIRINNLNNGDNMASRDDVTTASRDDVNNAPSRHSADTAASSDVTDSTDTSSQDAIEHL